MHAAMLHPGIVGLSEPVYVGIHNLPSLAPTQIQDTYITLHCLTGCLPASQALKAVRQIALVRPGDVEIAKQLARLHHRLGNAAEAKDTLQTHLHNYPTAVDLELINILAELYMNAEEWNLAVDNIQYANTQLCGPTGLPIDLQVRILPGIRPFYGDNIFPFSPSLTPRNGSQSQCATCTMVLSSSTHTRHTLTLSSLKARHR